MNDRDFDLIDSLFCRLVEKKNVSGDRPLTVAEQVVLTVWHSSGVIENGGLQNFYEHDLDSETVPAAYETIGCSECAEILRLSTSLFTDSVGQAGRDARVRFVERNREIFEQLNNRFWKADKLTQQRLVEYIKANVTITVGDQKK